jgi:hypothetical protein
MSPTRSAGRGTGSGAEGGAEAGAGAGGGRYQRSTGGLLGAMVIIVVAVVGFAALNALKNDHPATPVQTVDYHSMVKGGRADGKLLVMAPADLPQGWKATSAEYQTGVSPTWHLGTLTDQGRYVGVEEGRQSVQDLVEEHVDENAVQGKDVTIGGRTFQTWTDSGGDYAVSRTVRVDGAPYEAWLVVGSAPATSIRDFAATLRGGKLPKGQ